MNLPVQIFRKDLRRYWPLAVAAALLILLETLAPLWGWHVDIGEPDLNNLIVAFGKWPLVFILVVAVMQEDRTVGDKAFWRTRPIAPGALFAGKLLFFGLALALPAVLANIRVATALDAPGAVALGIAVETTGFMLLAVLTAALLAALTGTLMQAGLAALLGLAVVGLFAGLRALLSPYVEIRLPWDTSDVAYPGPRVAFACVLALVALGALLAHQFLTRRTGRTIALLAAAVPLVLVAAVSWRFETAPYSRAAAFPDKPLTRTEEIAFVVETPARVMGNTWTYDRTTRRYSPEPLVVAYADLQGAPIGRYFDVLETHSTLRLPDGRELTTPAIHQYGGQGWIVDQRDNAICRALGLEASAERSEQPSQGSLRIFHLPKSGFAEHGGKHARLTCKVLLGETAFREEFRMPARNGATHREPGKVWRLEMSDKTPTEMTLQQLRATTMFAPAGDSRADADPHDGVFRLFFLLNRKRGEYAGGSTHHGSAHQDIVTTGKTNMTFTRLRRGGRLVTDFIIDKAWLADAELIVLRTEPLGRVEKTVVIEDFEVPRLEQ